MVSLILFLIIIFLAAVALRGYLHGIMSPSYDPEKMTLNYERIGNGPIKIILLHGLTGSLRYWKDGLGDLSDSNSLLLIDLLGFGDSPKPKSEYSIEEHLGAIEKVVKKEGFDSGNCIVVGHSLGAILSMALVGEHPDWFRGLVVIGLPNYNGKKAIQNRFSKSSLWDSISVDSRYKFVCFFHPLYVTEFFRPKNIPMDVFKDVGKHTWISYYNTLDKVIIDFDLVELATKIKDKKILFIHGENDSAAPIENMEELLPIFKNAKCIKLPEADHQVYLAEPDKVWSLISSFFSEFDFSKNSQSTIFKKLKK
jgi:pimeloyl-ACP methyl ester carboxylesterase